MNNIHMNFQRHVWRHTSVKSHASFFNPQRRSFCRAYKNNEETGNSVQKTAKRFVSDLNLSRMAIISAPCLLLGGYLYWERRRKQTLMATYSDMITDKVYFDIAIGNRYAGRVLIGLYGATLPMTVENFKRLAEGYIVNNEEGTNTRVIGYKNTPFHSIQPGIMMVGGDVVSAKGSHSLSIYGPRFPDEAYSEFLQEGDVGMWNVGPNSNGSQFFITFAPMPSFNSRYVAVGTVLKGMKIIRECERESSHVATDLHRVRIIHSGVYNPERDGPDAIPDPRHMERLKTLIEERQPEQEALNKLLVETERESNSTAYTQDEILAMMEQLSSGRRMNVLTEEEFKKLSKTEQTQLAHEKTTLSAIEVNTKGNADVPMQVDSVHHIARRY